MLHDLARRRVVLRWIETQDSGLLDSLHAEGIDIEKFQTALRTLKPADDGQRWLQARALPLRNAFRQITKLAVYR